MLIDEKLNGRFISTAQGSASPLHSSSYSSSQHDGASNKTVAFKIALIVLALLFTETSYAANGNATSTSFSQKQITNFVKTVTTELELSKNWKASFANTAGSKLYCHSIILGEGFRAGSHGLYTWFTCSAMHKLTTDSIANGNIACTGFSSPVWIEPTANSIRFQAVSSGPEYVAFRTSAPAPVKTLMDSTFNQMNSGGPRVVIARATQGAKTQTNSCQ
ncbi:MAG TPA: hypothetical protein VGJ85_07335 [Candidatus Nanopelagicaceae bacterium]|jgi:hypothetical protein